MKFCYIMHNKVPQLYILQSQQLILTLRGKETSMLPYLLGNFDVELLHFIQFCTSFCDSFLKTVIQGHTIRLSNFLAHQSSSNRKQLDATDQFTSTLDGIPRFTVFIVKRTRGSSGLTTPVLKPSGSCGQEGLYTNCIVHQFALSWI